MSQVNIIQELSDAKIKFEFEGENHVKLQCPFHEDSGPSFSLKLDNGFGHCFGCGIEPAFTQFLAQIRGVSASEVERYLAKKYNLLTDEAAISPVVVDTYHEKIWEALPLIQALGVRAVSEETIRKYKLGADGGRIVIPVYTLSGRCVNLIKYLPNATRAKFKHAKGRGKNRLYPLDQLQYDKIILTGGPIKALAGTEKYNPKGIGCISALNGEDSWNKELSEQLEGKIVYVVFDVDDAGNRSADKVCSHLYAYAKEVYKVTMEFPESVAEEYPKGGLDDFISLGCELKFDETRWTPPQIRTLEDTEPVELTVNKAFNPDFVGHRLSVPVTISAVSETPYYLPKSFTVYCTHDAKVCALCPANHNRGENGYEAQLHKESKNLLALLDNPESFQFKILANEAGIPRGCNKFSIQVTSHQLIEDVRISPVIDLRDTDSEKTHQPAIIIGRTVEPNTSYKLTGRMYPHPETQKATLVCSEAETLADDLTGWKLQDPERLNILRPKSWSYEDLEAKIDEIYTSIEAHVTNIYNRRDMHIMADLAYHSCLFFEMDGRSQKGWAEILIIGDSSQGKTDCTLRLRDFYGLGERIDCKNATVAGLLGGNEQLNGKHFVQWGKIPKNDRGLVILEEIKGASEEVIGKLTDMRSSGVAQLPKIESRSAKARTRIIAISNPRGKRPLSTFSFGIDAVVELVGAPEDIRRFDAAIAINKETNNPFLSEAHAKAKPIDQKILRDCILFAWTCKNPEVSKVEHLLTESAERLTKKFVEDKCPLVDRGSIRYKLARLSIALALRTFSTEVFPCHVQFIENLIDRCYSGALNYDTYSKAVMASMEIANPEEVLRQIQTIPCSEYVVEELLQNGMFDAVDIEEWGGTTRDHARDFLSALRRYRCVLRKKTGYVKTAGFIEFLKKIDRTQLGSAPIQDRF